MLGIRARLRGAETERQGPDATVKRPAALPIVPRVAEPSLESYLNGSRVPPDDGFLPSSTPRIRSISTGRSASGTQDGDATPIRPQPGIVAVATNRNTMTFSGLTREPVIFQHTSTRSGLVQKLESGDTGWQDRAVSLRCSAAAPAQPLLLRLSRFYAYIPLRKPPPRRRGGESALPCQCLAAVLHVTTKGSPHSGLGPRSLHLQLGTLL